MKQQPLISLFGILFLISFLSGCATWDGGNASLRNFRTVILDPGHGGFDHGARSIRGLDEKDLNLDIAKRIRPYLKRQGYRVIMVRDKDIFIPLGTRARLSNSHPDAVFVSIHCNWATRRSARGIEVYHYSQKSEPFANQVLKEILPAYHATSRGVKYARFYVLRHNERPAILIEVGFVSNYQENNYLQNPHTRETLAKDIAHGIIVRHGPLRPAKNTPSQEPAEVLASSSSSRFITRSSSATSSADVLSSSSQHSIWKESSSSTTPSSTKSSSSPSTSPKTVTRTTVKRSVSHQRKKTTPTRRIVHSSTTANTSKSSQSKSVASSTTKKTSTVSGVHRKIIHRKTSVAKKVTTTKKK